MAAREGDAVSTLVGTRVTLRPPRAGDEALRQRHGWHAEVERCYGRLE